MKTTETGISLNPEQKRLIREFVSINKLLGREIWTKLLTQLVERCIYADREVINQNKE